MKRNNKFNVKDVVYRDIIPSNKPNKSVMQILKENNDQQTIDKEMDLFDKFEVRAKNSIT